MTDSREYRIPDEALGSYRESIYFHHMVGTGGNTLAKTISLSGSKYELVQVTHGANNYIAGDQSILNRGGPVLYYGHNLLGLPDQIDPSVQYMTILRNPFDRLVSDFFWLHQHESRCDVMDSFVQFVDSSDHLEFYIHHCGVLNYENRQHFSPAECSRLPNDKAYALARQRLDNRFWFVGCMELFEESLFVLAMRAGLKTVTPWWLYRHPRTPFRPNLYDLPASLRRTIATKTVYDMELWEHYRARLEEVMLEVNLGPDFRQYCNDAYPKG